MVEPRTRARVPWIVWTLLGLAVLVQVGLRASQPAPVARASALAAPPRLAFARAASLGEERVLGQWLALYLQAFDNQPGISVPFMSLDYARVELWLDLLLALDPAGSYPLLMAAHLYGQVPDATRTRRMLEFIHRHYLVDPPGRWRWLAHAVVIARHRLQDPRLALHYAQSLAEAPDGARTPGWARQMHIFLHEDLGEADTAKLLLGGLLASGTLSDPKEIHFLMSRLQALQAVENGVKNPSSLSTVRRSPGAPGALQAPIAPQAPLN